MKTKKSIYLWTLALCTLSFSACDKNNNKNNNDQNTELEIKEFSLSRVTNYGDDWIYFSFEKGKEIEITEENHTTNLSWDIAFNKSNIRTNSGTSGKGKGGALKTNETDLTKLSKAPESGYTIDESIMITKDLTEFPPPQMESSGNVLLCNAIAFSGPPPLYTVSENIYTVKTADSKYVKIQFITFYDENGESGHLTFKYAYQNDGTVNF